MQPEKPSILNLPNALTLLRLLLIPVFVVLMANNRMMPALGVFVFASLTDILDGWIARRYQLVTDFGKLADPLADKLMVLSAMLMLAIKGVAPWAAIGILLVKEALMLLGGFLLLRRNIVVQSEPVGKVAQFVTVLGLVLCFFHDRFASPNPPLHLWALWLGVGLAVISFFYYLRRNGVKLLKGKDGGTDA